LLFMPAINRQLLEQQRQARSLTQAQLGAACGVSESTVKKLAGGYRQPGIGLIHRLARELGCTYSDLIDLSQSRSPLQRMRLAAGLRQDDLAVRVGISTAHLINIEAGRRNPSARLRDDLASVLGCEPGDITGEGVAA
jgi:transcriptional regulator with XRE-family HTH domain